MTKKITSKNWTKVASKAFKSLAKIANDELAIANGETLKAPTGHENGLEPEVAPEEGAETAGPQEVVDAIEVIVSELEEVQEAIPAEPTQELDEDPAAEPTEPAAEPEPEPTTVEEEKIEVAKLKTQVAVLTKRLAQQDLEKAAERYAQLYDGPRVQEAKFQEVIGSKKDSTHWEQKIAAIEEYRSIQGSSDSSFKQAENKTNWITPRSKTAQLVSRGLTSL